jgi:hypothetical protein
MALLGKGDRHHGFPTTRRLAGGAWLVFLLASSSPLATLVFPSSTSAQATDASVKYVGRSFFWLPFDTLTSERPLQEIQLYVSDDQGRNWQKYDAVPPEKRGFNFRAVRDGMYWFTVRTIDIDGRASSVPVPGSQPQLKIYVDTQPPVVRLRQIAAREGMVAVEWDLRDDNLDLSTFSLSYRTTGSEEWLALPARGAETGQHSWSPGSTGAVEVRLRIRDLAKNEGSDKIRLTTGGGYVPGSNPVEPDPNRVAERTGPPMRWVNSKRVSLNYKIEKEGPSGVSRVELWFTNDLREGRKWNKLSEEANPKPPYVFDVQGEGVYGFTLVVKNGVGLGEAPPRDGDPPQIWVEVDLTKPNVHWVATEVGQGADTGTLTITWQAVDKNLGREPITLSYAEDAQGQWIKIPGAEGIENSGRFVWRKGPGPPHKFLVRVEATDKAGNVGSAVTTKPTLFDLAQPKSVILGVEPARDGAAKTSSSTGSNGD